MTIEAFKGGTTPLDETHMNNLMACQPFALIYDGTQYDAKTGAGVLEIDNASYNYMARFTATGVTQLARLELELIKHGTGADLIIDIKSGFLPDGSNDGTLLKTIVVPKEHIPTVKGYWSIPIDLTGLTAGVNYWLGLRKNGDGTNHFHVHAEVAQDASYPYYYRTGSSGAWSLGSAAIHFKAFQGDTGEIKHCFYGGVGYTSIELANDLPSKVYRYLPPTDGIEGGIRDVLTLSWGGELLKRGEI